MIATRFFLLGGHIVSPSSEHSVAVGMLKLKVQPSNLPIVAPDKNPSVLLAFEPTHRTSWLLEFPSYLQSC